MAAPPITSLTDTWSSGDSCGRAGQAERSNAYAPRTIVVEQYGCAIHRSTIIGTEAPLTPFIHLHQTL